MARSALVPYDDPMHTYDVIVLGTGGVGAAAVMHLAGRGVKVLGLEQFSHGHNRGSSHGQSRVIRMAYFEHANYVPLLRRAYELWFELEQATGQKLFHQVGLVEIGPPDGVIVPGVLRSAREHQLRVEELSAADVRRRFPGFEMPPDAIAVFEQNAGFLLVEQCVLAHLDQATRRGADLRMNERVVDWQPHANGTVTVRTTSEKFSAAKLVIAAGAWSQPILRGRSVPLRVVRKHLHWYATSDQRYRADRGAPTFFFERPDRAFFYGFPQIDELGVKVAEHSGGEDVPDPANVNRLVDPVDRARVEEFLQQHLRGVSLAPTRHEVCMYTLSPDENFVLENHPQHPQVAYAAGLSGHGFKFTSVLGEILADLTLTGRSSLPIEFLSSCRFSAK
jgi:monomeric sarcosine oxidase